MEHHDDRTRRYPENNEIEKVDGILRFFSLVTKKNETEHGIERPLPVRRERAKLFHLFKGTADRDERARLLREADRRDDVLRQYLRQEDVTVETEEWGMLSSRYAMLRPPEGETAEGPPIVFIPGISNDLASVDALAQELALSGRDVLVIGYPDSQMGTVDPRFAEAVERCETFEPHARYFSKAIDALLPAAKDLELWGFSTGAPIVAEMLAHDTEWREKAARAVLLNPAGAVEQTPLGVKTGLAKELHTWFSANVAKLGMVTGRRAGETAEPEGQRALKERIFGTLFERIQHVSAHWAEAKVRDGGDIVVLSATGDDVTKCDRTFNAATPPPNASMKVVEFDARHSGPIMRPAEAIRLIRTAQGKR